ncbi:VOC family protein [Evansella sp. LMS18]|uniref:VOC family protein n=1 Tax=Evansella sp. LMS18 TaxID=2924033 RepID=UPI0020D14444|nr:VOC family protein [Evansella sp. LMS18]UTR10634.1 VOC family protein [Evansella sp. LMS18]
MARVRRYQPHTMIAVHHIGAETENLEKTAAYLINKYKLKEERRFIFEGERIVFLSGDRWKIELIEVKKKSRQPLHTAFLVTDITSGVKLFQNLGYLSTEGPYLLDTGWKTVFLENEEGEFIELITDRNS